MSRSEVAFLQMPPRPTFLVAKKEEHVTFVIGDPIHTIIPRDTRTTTAQTDESYSPPRTQSRRLSEQETRAIIESSIGSQSYIRVLVNQIRHESGFQTAVISGTGDYGIAQINLRSHPDITADQAFDPNWSLRWFSGVMADKINRLGLRAALAAYNAGEGGIKNPKSKGWQYADKILAM